MTEAKWSVSQDYELYEEAKAIAEGTTMKLGTTAHVRLLWGMLEAAKEELAAAQEKQSPFAGDPYD